MDKARTTILVALCILAAVDYGILLTISWSYYWNGQSLEAYGTGMVTLISMIVCAYTLLAAWKRKDNDGHQN